MAVMQESSHMDDWKVSTAALIAAGAGIVTTIIGGFWTFISGRRKGATDAQGMIQEGFQKVVQEFATLVKELQEDRGRLLALVTQQAEENTRLRGENRQLVQTLLSMERHMSKHGLTYPVQEILVPPVVEF